MAVPTTSIDQTDIKKNPEQSGLFGMEIFMVTASIEY